MRHPFINWMATLLIAAIALQAPSQPIFFDGHKAVHDNLNNIWLCSIQQQWFHNDWTPVAALDSSWTDVIINGKPVATGDTVQFQDITGGKMYPFTARAGQELIAGNITFTWLPVIELNGNFGLEYVEGTVSINGPDSTAKDDMRAKLKWRGNYSNGSNKHKRNYHIKFIDKDGDKKNRSFFGLRKDNHWKLDAGQADRFRLRNRVANDLWLDMSSKPWYQELEPEAINGSRGIETEVILNGQYRGIYGLIEPVDRKQLKLVKHDSIANEFHGQLWYSRNWCRTGTMTAPLEWDNNQDMWDGIELDYPDFEEVHPTDWSPLADAITFIKQVDNTEDYQWLNDSIGSYFDLPVMMDYFIFIISLQAIGNESINIYYNCYDQALDRRISMTAWDLDNSVGSKHFSNWSSRLYSPERSIYEWISNLSFYELFLSSKYRKTMIDRYWQLRHTWLNTQNLIARYQEAVDNIIGCGAAAREKALWSGDSDIYGRSIDFVDEMNYIANWIERRMAYLDENVFVRELTPGDINGDGEVDVADVAQLIKAVLGDIAIDNDVADINGDTVVDVADVSMLINMILGK